MGQWSYHYYSRSTLIIYLERIFVRQQICEQYVGSPSVFQLSFHYSWVVWIPIQLSTIFLGQGLSNVITKSD